MSTALLLLAALLLLPATGSATTLNSTTVAISPDGTRVYAGFNGVGFSVFNRSIGSGRLTALGEASGGPTGGGLFDPSIAVSPDGLSVYGVDGQGNALLQYAPAGEGVVLRQSYPVLADTTVAKDPISLAISPDGSSVYVLTYGVQYGTGIGVTSSGKINTFHRDAGTGNLALVGTTPLGTDNGGAIGVDPVVTSDGRFVYVASPSVSGGVLVLSRDTTSGVPTVLGHDGELNGGIAIAISPDGNYVYEVGPPTSTSAASSAISVLARNATTGRLTPASEIQNGAGGVSGLSDMWSVAVSPDGHCLYTTSRADGSLGYFTRDPATGALTFGGVVSEGSGAIGLAGAREVVVSPDGSDVYVASPNDGGVAVFDLNPITCAPTFLELVGDLFTLGKPLVNSAEGTATLPVTADTQGTLDISIAPVTKQPYVSVAAKETGVIPVGRPGLIKVPITLDPTTARALDVAHRLDIMVLVTFTTTRGTTTTKTTVVPFIKTPASLSKLHISPSKFSLAGRNVKGRCVAPTRKNNAHKHCRRPIRLQIGYALNVRGTVAFTLKLRAPGRRVNGRCVKPTRKIGKRRRCTRLVDVRGKIVQGGKAGLNHFSFDGLIGGRRLRAGSYELIAAPLGGKPKKAAFKIVR